VERRDLRIVEAVEMVDRAHEPGQRTFAGERRKRVRADPVVRVIDIESLETAT
jgi:hypothetical protein